MARKIAPQSSTHFYHITARSNNKEWFKSGIESTWAIMERYLHFIDKAYKVETMAFVLMSNHYHWLVKFPEGNISDALRYFMRETSRIMSRNCHRINHSYGIRNHKSLIDSDHYLFNVYRYVYQNPVRAGLSEQVEDYPFSTAYGLVGRGPLLIPVKGDLILSDTRSLEQNLKWLNQRLGSKVDESIRKGLRRGTFRPSIDRSCRTLLLK